MTKAMKYVKPNVVIMEVLPQQTLLVSIGVPTGVQTPVIDNTGGGNPLEGV